MRSPSPPILLLAVLFAALPGPPAAAQDAAELGPHRYLAPDSAQLAASAARSSLSFWHVSTNGTGETTVYVRNNAARPVRIIWFEVRDCINIPRKICGRHSPGPTIKPGKTSRLVVVRRERNSEGWSYTYQFQAEWGDAPGSDPVRNELPLLLDDPACAGRPVDTATVYDPGELDAPVRLLALGTVDTPAADGDDQASAVLGFVIGKDGRVEPCSVRILRQNSLSWARASLRALESEQFTIPERQGQPVRTQRSQRFSYRDKQT